MKKLFTWESWAVFMEMGRVLAIFIAVTKAIESFIDMYLHAHKNLIAQ